MNTYKIWIMGLLLVFVVEVWVSISNIESDSLLLSFIAMLVAIYALFTAYILLRDSLAERLKVSE